jgi:undecaprenyl-diphosphatase
MAGRTGFQAGVREGLPVLEPSEHGPAQRFARLVGHDHHPVLVFAVAVVGGFVVLAACSWVVGLLLTHVLADTPGIASANRHVDSWLAARRTPGRTEASLIGSIMAGGVVLPIVAGLFALACATLRHWRLAGFVVFALAGESGAYRATTFVVHEHRPHVSRLEQLPVNASYPSGHTAASIAVYGGLALLVTSKLAHPAIRTLVWTLAAAIPIFVGLSRMYRGMHYPLDVMGGALLGLGALVVMTFACRAAEATAHPAARSGTPPGDAR